MIRRMIFDVFFFMYFSVAAIGSFVVEDYAGVALCFLINYFIILENDYARRNCSQNRSERSVLCDRC